MKDRLWNLAERTRFFVDENGDIQLLSDDVETSVVEYLQGALNISEQAAYNMPRGYLARGRIVFFHGRHYGAWPSLNGTIREAACRLYKDNYVGEPVIYNGVYKGIAGEEWPPILYWSGSQGWQVADGWKV